jgi:hypothetical protein
MEQCQRHVILLCRFQLHVIPQHMVKRCRPLWMSLAAPVSIQPQSDRHLVVVNILQHVTIIRFARSPDNGSHEITQDASMSSSGLDSARSCVVASWHSSLLARAQIQIVILA